MKQIKHVSIKKASNAVLKRMRQIGVDKAERLQNIQKRWDNGDYKDIEIVNV